MDAGKDDATGHLALRSSPRAAATPHLRTGAGGAFCIRPLRVLFDNRRMHVTQQFGSGHGRRRMAGSHVVTRLPGGPVIRAEPSPASHCCTGSRSATASAPDCLSGECGFDSRRLRCDVRTRTRGRAAYAALASLPKPRPCVLVSSPSLRCVAHAVERRAVIPEEAVRIRPT